jgi:hypothetical protein
MWGTVFMVALFTAPNPVHLGIAVVLLSRPRPLLNLLAFWLGGMVVGFAGLGGLTLLRDSLPTVAQNVVSTVTGFTGGGHARIIIGVLALLIAALTAVGFSVRQRARVPIRSGDTWALPPGLPTAFSRLSACTHHAMEGGRPWIGFVAGLAFAIPPVEYLVALTVILASGAAIGAQLSAALMFTMVVLAVVEVPLISYLVTPAKTRAVTLQLHNWVRARRRQTLAVIVAVAGVLLVATGMASR